VFITELEETQNVSARCTYVELDTYKDRESGITYRTVYAEDTGVKYLICEKEDAISIAPLYDAEGSLQVSETTIGKGIFEQVTELATEDVIIDNNYERGE
jgi:hypothetical protein